MSMQTTGDNTAGEPMLDINVTPLIDVMLVLLIMFIITLPPQTHAVKLDLPQDNNAPPPPIMPTKNQVVITAAGQILWNGTPISDSELVTDLRVSRTLPVEPELQFEPEPEASYDLSAQVLNLIKASGVTKFGFVGNEQYRQFGKKTNAMYH